ncbi:hypothetical protein HK097_004152, partial [Rhizophlyctis rosea]
MHFLNYKRTSAEVIPESAQSTSPPPKPSTKKHLYIVSRRPTRPVINPHKSSRSSSIASLPRPPTSRKVSNASSSSSSSSSGPRTPLETRHRYTGAYHHAALTRIDSFSSVWSEAYDLEGERAKWKAEEEMWEQDNEWEDEELVSGDEGNEESDSEVGTLDEAWDGAGFDGGLAGREDSPVPSPELPDLVEEKPQLNLTTPPSTSPFKLSIEISTADPIPSDSSDSDKTPT